MVLGGEIHKATEVLQGNSMWEATRIWRVPPRDAVYYWPVDGLFSILISVAHHCGCEAFHIPSRLVAQWCNAATTSPTSGPTPYFLLNGLLGSTMIGLSSLWNHFVRWWG